MRNNTINPNKTILFDLDRTLIDTDKLNLLRNAIEADYLGISLDEAKAIHREYTGGVAHFPAFDPKQYAQFLAEKFSVAVEKLYKQVYLNQSIYQASLFADTLTTLNEFAEKRINIGIYSEGVKDWQLVKLNLAGLLKFFPKQELLIIEKDKRTTEIIANLPQEVVIVDDLQECLEPLYLSRNDLRLFWINRKDEQVDQRFTTINNLTQLLGSVF